jgi:pyruvate/2-oxoglutarate dehydrogenase complex dihydrolipoamide acyltransferase (E2) component
VPGQMMTLTLACDHRIIYLAQAAAFLTAVKRLIEQATL